MHARDVWMRVACRGAGGGEGWTHVWCRSHVLCCADCVCCWAVWVEGEGRGSKPACMHADGGCAHLGGDTPPRHHTPLSPCPAGALRQAAWTECLSVEEGGKERGGKEHRHTECMQARKGEAKNDQVQNAHFHAVPSRQSTAPCFDPLFTHVGRVSASAQQQRLLQLRDTSHSHSLTPLFIHTLLSLFTSANVHA